MNGSLLSPERLLIALLFAVSLSLLYPQAAYSTTGSALGAIIGGVGVLALLRWREAGWKGLGGRTSLAMCLMAVWALWWLALWSIRSEVPVLGTGSVATILQTACVFVAVIGLSNLLPEGWKTRQIIPVWISLFASAVALHALYQVMGPEWLPGTFSARAAAIEANPDALVGPTREGILHALREGRASGVFGSPNIFAGFLAMALPIVLSISVTRSSKAIRLASVLSVLLLLAAIVISGSRGGLIGALVGLFTFAVLYLPSRTLATAAMVSVGFMMVGAVSSPTSLERWTATSTIQQRLAYWEAGKEIWLESPLMGHGPGGFELHYPRHRLPFANETRFAHNWVVQWSCEVGIVGVMLVVAWMSVVFFSGIGMWRGEIPRDPLIAGLLAAFVVLTIHGLVEFTLSIRELMLFLSVIAAVLMSSTHPSKWETLRPIGVSGAALGVGLFVASWWFVQFAPARAEALRESVAYAPPEEGIRLLSSAIQWQPRDPALWESRGFLRYSAGIPDARGDLEKALSLNPHSSRLHESLGLLLWTMGNKVEAMALQEKAITLHPADPDRRITMAGYLFDEGRVDEAIGMIESTTELLWTRTGGQAARDQLLARIAVLQSASHEGSGDEPSPTE